MKLSKQKVGLYKGELFVDFRGKLFHNNIVDLTRVKRFYSIENINKEFLRGWKGHEAEKRWFICVKGKVSIWVIKNSDLNNRINTAIKFTMTEDNLDVLYVPEGNATLLKKETEGGRIMVFSDYMLNTSNDEHLRWPKNQIEL